MTDSFTTMVVPSDLGSEHDRAIAAAGALASLGDLPITLVTVSSPGMPEESDRLDLRRAAESHHLGNWSGVVLHDNEPTRAIAAYVATLEAPLVILASSVRTGLSEMVAPDIAGQLLSELACPALIVGPNVPESWVASRPRLVSCVGSVTIAHLPFVPLARWVGTFGGNAPCFATVIASSNAGSSRDDDRTTGDLQHLAEEFRSTTAITAEWKVLHNDDPVNGLLAWAESIDDALLVVTSERWLDRSRIHRRSVARRLAHDSTKPVLVIPHLAR